MNTFDDALKFLAQRNPGDFIRFALGDPSVAIVKPLPSSLPSRRRDIDGCYLVHTQRVQSDELIVAHLEFHRRKQSLDELAIDVTEAQIRLYRRERKKVTSLVWDLYGKRNEPFLEQRTLMFGKEIHTQGSRGVYLRVNLRGIEWRQLLQRAPAVLWPLVALTRGGAEEEAILGARKAIAGQKNLGFSDHANYLAILRFVAEAERVPRQLLDTVLEEEFIMASDYYQSVIAKGETRTLATVIVDILERRRGRLDKDVRNVILAETNLERLRSWKDLALDALDAQSAQHVVDEIRKSRTA